MKDQLSCVGAVHGNGAKVYSVQFQSRVLLFTISFKQFDFRYLAIVSLMFLVLGVHEASWICEFMVFSNLENLWPLCVQIFFLPSPPWGLHVPMLDCLVWSTAH